MINYSWKRNLIGLGLVIALFSGGYYRWNRLPVAVSIEIDPGQVAMTCGMQRADLKKMPHTSGIGAVAIQLPLDKWNPEVSLLQPSIWGRTMGTTYSIRIADHLQPAGAEKLINDIILELQEVNRQMSTWDMDSEISMFNHSISTNPITVSEGFAKVVSRALDFSETTDGAFDPTLQPLLNLWGFGSEGVTSAVPSDVAIAEAKAMTGWEKVSVPSPTGLRKSEPEVSLALGAIAKGYGVDAVAHILEKAGFENWFVEIGGEVVVKGLNPAGVPWKIGIQYPDTNPLDDALQGILNFSSGAVATSGDYRNYLEKDGVIYTHILDPRTGRTVLSHTASVSVFADNCTDADGMATALYVMGPEEGLVWVENRPGVEAMFLLRETDGSIIEKFSSGFVRATGYISSVDANHP